MRKVAVVVSVFCASVVLLALTGCGGSSPFVPNSGAFLGNFRDGTAASIGELSFTAHQTGLAGTGVINSGALVIDVAVSGNVNNGVITGLVSNAFLGSGSFRGKFNGEKAASGTFTFEIVTGTDVTGTWSAAVD